MKKMILFGAMILTMTGCASSRAAASVSTTSTGNASVESVSNSGAVLKTEKNGKSENVSIDNNDHIVVIRERKTISPAALIPGEQVEITYYNGSISAICVQSSD